MYSRFGNGDSVLSCKLAPKESLDFLDVYSVIAKGYSDWLQEDLINITDSFYRRNDTLSGISLS